MLSFEYNPAKVWEFLESKELIPTNNLLTSKELYYSIIDKNPKLLIAYSDFNESEKAINRDNEILEKRKEFTRNRLNNLNENINEEIPTFYDLQYWNSSPIFEAEEIKTSKATPEDLQKAEKFYNELVEHLKTGKELDEGFLTGLLGGAAGALVGPAVGKAICKILGIDQNGHLGKLLTSRLVTTAIGYELGS